MSKCKGHVPIRMCLSCRAKRSKRELIRLILDARCMVVRDDCGKGDGRGGYVCPSRSCWDGLGKSNRLSHAFRREGLTTLHAEFLAE